MLLILVFVMTIVSIVISLVYSRGKSTQVKLLIWGFTILVMSPALSWLISLGVTRIAGEGFAGIAILSISVPVIFLIGIIIILIGIIIIFSGLVKAKP